MPPHVLAFGRCIHTHTHTHTHTHVLQSPRRGLRQKTKQPRLWRAFVAWYAVQPAPAPSLLWQQLPCPVPHLPCPSLYKLPAAGVSGSSKQNSRLSCRVGQSRDRSGDAQLNNWPMPCPWPCMRMRASPIPHAHTPLGFPITKPYSTIGRLCVFCGMFGQGPCLAIISQGQFSGQSSHQPAIQAH